MISVIIPVLNEADFIEPSIRNLLNHQDDIEVVVADGGSSDGTMDIVGRFPEVKQVISTLVGNRSLIRVIIAGEGRRDRA